jgi:protein-disulfide isomerase
MRLKVLSILLLMISMTLPASKGMADVNGQIVSKLTLAETPLDMRLSRDGNWLYLLTASGNLLIYSSQGNYNGKISVGQGFDQIEAGPTQAEVYLLSRKNKSIQVFEVSYTFGIDISASPFKGPADAPVVIAEFTDFQCPYCARLGSTLDQIMKMYPGKIKIVYKSFPLNSHKYSWKAATAAVAANEKGKFWEFYKLLFDNYNQINDAKLVEIRRLLGFDTPEFEALMDSAKIRERVAKDREEGLKLGVNGTPTVFINGKRLKNKRPEGFKEAIDAALKK